MEVQLRELTRSNHRALSRVLRIQATLSFPDPIWLMVLKSPGPPATAARPAPGYCCPGPPATAAWPAAAPATAAPQPAGYCCPARRCPATAAPAHRLLLPPSPPATAARPAGYCCPARRLLLPGPPATAARPAGYCCPSPPATAAPQPAGYCCPARRLLLPSLPAYFCFSARLPATAAPAPWLQKEIHNCFNNYFNLNLHLWHTLYLHHLLSIDLAN